MSRTILVTSANSFIAGWILKSLLDKGYNVRGTVRSQGKKSRVLAGISNDQQCQISFVHINDITTDSLDKAVEGIDSIIHVASPVHLTMIGPEKDFLLSAINGTLRVLQAAHKYNQSHSYKINRIVIASSFSAVNDASKGLRPDYSYTEKDWCPLTYADGVAAKGDYLTVYRASKTCAEPAETWNHQTIVDIVHGSSSIPDSIKNTTPIGTKGEQLPRIYNIDSSKAQKDLGVTYIPLSKTMEDLILEFAELKEKLAYQ
ncbi:unnamed protein product [Rotaria sp. Silwood1]|nr:unnamed protein product [Rotaria sp. Silwood1]